MTKNSVVKKIRRNPFIINGFITLFVLYKRRLPTVIALYNLDLKYQNKRQFQSRNSLINYLEE